MLSLFIQFKYRQHSFYYMHFKCCQHSYNFYAFQMVSAFFLFTYISDVFSIFSRFIHLRCFQQSFTFYTFQRQKAIFLRNQSQGRKIHHKVIDVVTQALMAFTAVHFACNKYSGTLTIGSNKHAQNNITKILVQRMGQMSRFRALGLNWTKKKK